MRNGTKGGQLKLVSRGKIEKIHQAALTILEEKGIQVEEPKSRRILEENGCQIDSETHVAKIPREVVKESLETAPSSFKMGARDEANEFELSPDKSFFTAGTGTTSVLDQTEGKRRKATKEDLTRAVKLGDQLSNIDVVWSIFTLTDDPMLGFYQLYAVLAKSTKHGAIVNWYGGELTNKLIDMIAVVAGGRDKLANEKPVTMYAEPVSPLTFRKENLEVLLRWTDVGLPLLWYPAQKAGATAPMTIAGSLAQAFAESLGGNVIAQLNNPGTPVILGASPLVMDMRSALNTYFSPEMLIIQSATGQWGKLIEMPIFGTGGCTNSYALDYQAGVESAVSLYGAVLSGQNLIHDLSFAGAGDLGSLELLTLTDEIAGMTKRAARKLSTEEEAIALEVIDQVDHGGDFLREEHTFKHFRDELMVPEFIRRIGDEKWEENYAINEAASKTRRLIEEAEIQPLAKDKDQQLREIIGEARSMM
ncbi:trimethylamine methyltransferase family protein [Candidatus Bipolaricaulota bacterium]|nr:trimethylamine methyltransferase family protein [Candidatus Bipolaricaulota bacterium]MBS3792611.1 trimethylamine methyltransferase family protein [Candidatus Bipolaricaulota bacterium]